MNYDNIKLIKTCYYVKHHMAVTIKHSTFIPRCTRHAIIQRFCTFELHNFSIMNIFFYANIKITYYNIMRI